MYLNGRVTERKRGRWERERDLSSACSLSRLLQCLVAGSGRNHELGALSGSHISEVSPENCTLLPRFARCTSRELVWKQRRQDCKTALLTTLRCWPSIRYSFLTLSCFVFLFCLASSFHIISPHSHVNNLLSICNS